MPNPQHNKAVHPKTPTITITLRGIEQKILRIAILKHNLWVLSFLLSLMFLCLIVRAFIPVAKEIVLIDAQNASNIYSMEKKLDFLQKFLIFF